MTRRRCRPEGKDAEDELIELDSYQRRMWFEVSEYPWCIQDMYRRYPLWSKYRFRAHPNSAVRLLQLFVMVDRSVMFYFDPHGRQEKLVNMREMCMYVRRYQYLILTSLPDELISNTTLIEYGCGKRRATSLGALICDYADPCSFSHLAVVAHDPTNPAIKDDNPAKLSVLQDVDIHIHVEIVKEFSAHAHKALDKIDPSYREHFLAPLGFITLRSDVVYDAPLIRP
jgi:hypothetical protein